MKRVHYAMGLIGLAGLVAAPHRAWGQSAWPGYPNNGAISALSNGNVGIGVTSPAIKTEIANGGSAYNLYLSGFAPSMFFGGASGVHPNGGAGQTSTGIFALATANGHYGMNAGDMIVGTQSFQAGNSSALRFVMPANDSGAYWLAMSVLRNGNVGIGTASPQYKLSVNGAIGAKDIIVTNSGWSDYVFRPGYRLRPLSEVGAYIRQHGHLPEIPSEAEVKARGVSVGDMQAKLLAKIEELTLHLIEQEKEKNELRERITRLESRVASNSAPATTPVR